MRRGRGLAFAPGLLDGSALPGEPGVAVIAAHRDTHFRALARLALGDRFDIERADGEAFVYAVDGDRRHRYATAIAAARRGESVVALVTCYPFDALVPGGTLRYVVTGELRRATATPRRHRRGVDSCSNRFSTAQFQRVTTV